MFLKAVSRFRRFPVLALCFSPLFCPDWGFFGHKRINRMAATTLPPEMQVFFKPNIDYLADHAVDPDMRRYALSWEAPRHYIDLDQYHAPDALPPVRWLDALLHYTEVKGITASGDTLRLYAPSDSLQATWKGFFAREIIPRFHKEDKNLPLDSLLKAAEVDCSKFRLLYKKYFLLNPYPNTVFYRGTFSKCTIDWFAHLLKKTKNNY